DHSDSTQRRDVLQGALSTARIACGQLAYAFAGGPAPNTVAGIEAMMEARAVLTADDLLTLKSVNDAQIDPGGRRVAFVVAEASVDYQEPSPRSRIWLVDVAGGEPRQVSQGPGTDDLPRWSPDGETLAFRSRPEEAR